MQGLAINVYVLNYMQRVDDHCPAGPRQQQLRLPVRVAQPAQQLFAVTLAANYGLVRGAWLSQPATNCSLVKGAHHAA
jgi:hypothetical protein